MAFTLHGIPVSQGIAIGKTNLLSSVMADVSHYLIPESAIDDELARFDAAVASVQHDLQQIKLDLAEDTPNEFAAFLELHSLILSDHMLQDEPRQLIRTRHYNAEWAITTQMQTIIEQFEALDDEYMRERAADVRQVVERVLKALTGVYMCIPEHDNTAASEMILVAHDIAPHDMLQFKNHRFAGFVTDLGGATSHTAIVARSLGIPAVVGAQIARALIKQDEYVIIDGDAGVVIVDPTPMMLEEYRVKHSELEIAKQRLRRLRNMAALTLDGTEIELHANIELPDDIPHATDSGATGVGLFRTEFLFMNRDDLPTEDEQFEAYRATLVQMGNAPVTIRTLDIGADKMLGNDQDSRWAMPVNPALGLRAIRWSLAEPQLFLTQLRAILRASAYGNAKILLPMVAHAFEVDQALNLLAQAKAQLALRGVPFNPEISVGAMIEIPGAALALPMLTKRLQFLSIGTNDLIQYTLAIDRVDNAVAHLYDPLHPAILYLIHQTILAGQKAGIPVSVCGEMAGEPNLTRLLLAMGLRQFSMHPAQLLRVKQEVLHADLVSLEPQIKKILKATEPEKIQELVAELRKDN
jgi:phosphoenolpyruvate-protein phosphotransferase (PTS system enzyme I)